MGRADRLDKNLVALVSGLLFAAGLALSGMTQPAKVTGFLDFAGAWDPSLAFVMVGAIGVAAVAFRVAARRDKPLLAAASFDVPARLGPVDRDLVLGAAIFGVGWGLSGYCPGPALESLASGRIGPVVFVVFMVGGMALEGLRRRTYGPSKAEDAQALEGTARES